MKEIDMGNSLKQSIQYFLFIAGFNFIIYTRVYYLAGLEVPPRTISF